MNAFNIYASWQPDTVCYAFYRDELLLDASGAVPRMKDMGWAMPLSVGTVAHASISEGIWMEMPHASISEGIWMEMPAGMPLRWRLMGRREVWAAMGAEVFNACLTAWHIMDWQRNSRFCGACGTVMRDGALDRSRECPVCGRLCYPTISPAVIVSIVRDGKILLGHNMRFDRCSILAGFVEPGETLEQAVHREIFEESGVRVKNLRYVDSQPWPFPASIMLGFEAEWESGELRPDGYEIDHVAWYAPEALPLTPTAVSIAGRLIERFRDGKFGTV